MPDGEAGSGVGGPVWVEPVSADDGCGADEEDYEGEGKAAEG